MVSTRPASGNTSKQRLITAAQTAPLNQTLFVKIRVIRGAKPSMIEPAKIRIFSFPPKKKSNILHFFHVSRISSFTNTISKIPLKKFLVANCHLFKILHHIYKKLKI